MVFLLLARPIKDNVLWLIPSIAGQEEQVMPPSKIRLFTVLSQLIERAELVLSRPTDEKLRIELDAQLNTADWPFVVDNGGDDSIKVKVDEARSAAQIVRVHLSAAPVAYRAALEQLVDALRMLKREFDL